jgi:2-(1,2-epoxy-1,2-dihydrophenyl)acetyl-CoA isomerase
VGPRRAKELALLNPVLSAKQALEWGLINRVVPDAEVLPAALEIAQGLAAGPTRAYGETKRLIAAGAAESLEAQMERESRSIAALAGSPDGQEGMAAFIGKRPPKFTGR